MTGTNGELLHEAQQLELMAHVLAVVNAIHYDAERAGEIRAYRAAAQRLRALADRDDLVGVTLVHETVPAPGAGD